MIRRIKQQVKGNKMERWEKNLKHERDARDGFVACGNPAPKEADTPGSLIRVSQLKFNGKIFWTIMEARGHDKGDFSECKCRKDS